MRAHDSGRLRLRSVAVGQLPGGLAEPVEEERHEQPEPECAAADDQEVDASGLPPPNCDGGTNPTSSAAREAAKPTPQSPISIGAR